jgi:uncharacterized membrane protein
MGIFFALIAALFASVGNFCLRRSIDAGGSAKAYLAIPLTCSFMMMILLNPVRTGDYGWNRWSLILGMIGGVILGILMWGLGKALEKGPPGLTFAILNSSSVVPAVLLALLFGPLYNHPYTFANALGSLLVAIGLFWAGWTSQANPHKKIWLCFVAFIFVLHTLLLLFLQWWAMILKPNLPSSQLIPIRLNSEHIQWFMPSIFLIGAIVQWLIYLRKHHHIPRGIERTYGILGGVAHGICNFFLIFSPQVSNAWENAVIFPIFSLGIIVICNSWAQLLYKESVNWMANSLSIAGLLIGTMGFR